MGIYFKKFYYLRSKKIKKINDYTASVDGHLMQEFEPRFN